MVDFWPSLHFLTIFHLICFPPSVTVEFLGRDGHGQQLIGVDFYQIFSFFTLLWEFLWWATCPSIFSLFCSVDLVKIYSDKFLVLILGLILCPFFFNLLLLYADLDWRNHRISSSAQSFLGQVSFYFNKSCTYSNGFEHFKNLQNTEYDFCSKGKNFGVKKGLISRGKHTHTRQKKPILDFTLNNEFS